MKRNLLVTLLVIVLVASLGLSLIACGGKGNGDDGDGSGTGGNGKATVDIKLLPDMVDYGANPQYYATGSEIYQESVRLGWKSDLEKKQDDEREDWIVEEWSATGSLWNNTVYYSFGAWAADYDSNGVERRQSNVGYFDVDGNWIDDESANSVQRVFCYSVADDFIQRLSDARVEEANADKLIKYIVREDVDRAKGDGYTYTQGTSSAIEDYNQLDELQTIYDDFDAYKKDPTYTKHIFTKEEEVSDAINRKKRKIYGEVFHCFGDDVDQFARCAIELVSYGIKIINADMLKAYNSHFNKEYNFEDYIRYEMFDHETLSYFLAFMDANITNFNLTNYTATQKAKMMTLYGYYYQYEKRDHEVFDDNKKVSAAGGITEYEDYLKLSHESYFNTKEEALRYRDYDRRHYEKAYRYSYTCYEKYYTAQLGFQAIQEEKDLIVYKGGATPTFNNSLVNGQYANGLTTVADITYSSEMQKGSSIGLDSTLKLSDVNWEYTASDDVTIVYNNRSRDWNSLDANGQNAATNKIKKVRLELEQLKSQDYTINHKSIKESDLTAALQYQIYSYSADSVRALQACKKDEVVYYLTIDRYFEVNDTTYADITGGTEFRTHVVKAFGDLEEDAGRNDAKYVNLNANYAVGTIDEQVRTANNADWAGVKSNISETLSRDYEGYKPVNNKQVDEYFEDTLIRKEWSCGASFEESATSCKQNNSHLNCTEEYDTDWALSRLLDNHEVVLRYMYGQVEVTFYAINQSDFLTPTKFHNNITSVKETDSYVAKATGGYAMSYKSFDACDKATLQPDELIGKVCTSTDEDKYPVVGMPSQYWNNVPVYETTDFLCDKTQTKLGQITYANNGTYIYTFVGWYVDEKFKYPVLLDEEYDYDIRLYPAYRLEYVPASN
ncbi:MAG: hypothetical protein IKA77_06085 [Clostridia bacterium]|nr:hypothetical protein [Clostridia bacterium]